MRRQFRILRTDDGFALELSAGVTRRCWSVPKGPSLDPAHRRAARELSTIPAVAESWDQGTWGTTNPAGDLASANALELQLRGSRLHGKWLLSQSARGGWSFVKQQDDFAIAGADADAIDLAFATLAPSAPAEPSRTRSTKPLEFMPLALAALADAAPSGEEWVHDVKLDGYRIEALIDSGGVRLMSRNAKDWTARFPTIADALRKLDVTSAAIDGEIVAIGEKGVSSFQLLQQSFDAPLTTPLRYYAFDILVLDGRDLRAETLDVRWQTLGSVIGRRSRTAIVQLVQRFDPADGDVLEQASAAGEEGVISKRLDARYMSGRGRGWLKVKVGKRQEFIIVGYTDPQGSRAGFGSLLLGVMEGESLRYSGRVGTGFDTNLLDKLYRKLRSIEISTNPLHITPPGVPLRNVHWVKPKLVAEVAFLEWTSDGVLRHPSFKGLREDKLPNQVRRED